MLAYLILVGLAAIGLGAVVVAAGLLVQRRAMSIRAIAAAAGAIVLVVVAVWATLTVADDVEADAAPTATATTAPRARYAGIAGNGNCPPECLAAAYSRSIGARAAVYLHTR